MNKTVYVLIAQDYEDVTIEGVFTTREKTEEEMKNIGHDKGKGQYVDNEQGMWLEIIETELKGEN